MLLSLHCNLFLGSPQNKVIQGVADFTTLLYLITLSLLYIVFRHTHATPPLNGGQSSTKPVNALLSYSENRYEWQDYTDSNQGAIRLHSHEITV